MRRGNKREGISMGEGIVAARIFLVDDICCTCMVEENEKKSNVCKIFLTFPLPICELIEIKGMERSHHGARFFPDWSVCSGYSRIIINIR